MLRVAEQYAGTDTGRQRLGRGARQLTNLRWRIDLFLTSYETLAIEENERGQAAPVAGN